jgi:secretion/DNA translocation related TadE-like protein
MKSAPAGDRGSATVWTVALIGLLAAVASAILLLVSAIGCRHTVERAADAAALAAAQAAMSGLRSTGDPQSGRPCAAAIQAIRQAQGHVLLLRRCECDVVDCAVTVEGSFLSGLGMDPLLGGRLPVLAAAQAGPVGETGQDQGVGIPVGDDAAPG